MHHGHDRGINLRVSYLKFRRQASQILDQIEEYSCGSTRYFKESMLMDNIVPFVSLKVIRFFFAKLVAQIIHLEQMILDVGSNPCT